MDNRNAVNFNEGQPYVVGILSPSTTLYIDQEVRPPSDLNLRRRNTNNSFQITSVTVQGSRKNDDFGDDSADDLDESHTDDLSSDFLDSSRADNEGYHSEDSNPMGEDLSPCGPIIFTQLPQRDPNMNNLSIGVTPTFTAIGPSVVAGGVTMMTSKSESPVSAQVPIMNPLPDNWQRRFKVVKIVSSEPFRRGRWLCMDFKDPPTSVPSANGTGTPPAIQVTNCDHEVPLSGEGFAQVYEIPINQTFNGNFVVGNQQQMYGIILPQTEHLQPVTLVQDMSLQTTDRNFNHIVHSPSIVVDQPHTITGRPPSVAQSANINSYARAMPHSVHNHIVNAAGRNSPDVIVMRTNAVEESRPVPIPMSRCRIEDTEQENSESFSSLANELSRASGVFRRNPPTDFGANDLCCSPPVQSRIPTAPLIVPATNKVAPAVVAPPLVPVAAETRLPVVPAPDIRPNVQPAASTGGNTVAIDNKIEQAMDLVKSHLMFAVREEVEVLKEKITELLERISQLEHENDILRANASAETLKQLNNQSQKKNTGGGTTGKHQPMAAVPPST